MKCHKCDQPIEVGVKTWYVYVDDELAPDYVPGEDLDLRIEYVQCPEGHKVNDDAWEVAYEQLVKLGG